ncbi:MAG TPA: hypothetical protein VFY71_13980 [Planctomycetota bacterium]|nr:hypothetical protein [Planctomycetota bacterium]
MLKPLSPKGVSPFTHEETAMTKRKDSGGGRAQGAKGATKQEPASRGSQRDGGQGGATPTREGADRERDSEGMGSRQGGYQVGSGARSQDQDSSQGDEHEEVWTSPQRHRELEAGDEGRGGGSPGSSRSGGGARSSGSSRSGGSSKSGGSTPSGGSRGSSGRGSSRSR